MKKIAVLVCKTRSGELLSEASESLIPIEAKAREVRASGEMDGKPVESGFVMATWRAGCVMKFACKPAEAKADAVKPRKAKG
jgi:hypothetical protein